MAKNEFYTYLHKKADTGEVFYVGKGKGQRATTKYNRSKYWRNVVEKHGLLVEIYATYDDESKALADEVRLIAEFRAAGIKLVNLTDGGEGVSGVVFTEDRIRKIKEHLTGKTIPQNVRDKISASLKGRKVGTRSPEHAAKLADARRGKKFTEEQLERHRIAIANRRYGVTDETRRKLSVASIGRRLTDEHKEKLRIANIGNTHSLGKKRSDETKKKMSEALIGRVYGEEVRERMREGAKNRPKISDATRQRMSESQLNRWKKVKS